MTEHELDDSSTESGVEVVLRVAVRIALVVVVASSESYQQEESYCGTAAVGRDQRRERSRGIFVCGVCVGGFCQKKVLASGVSSSFTSNMKRAPPHACARCRAVSVKQERGNVEYYSQSMPG